MPARIFSSVDLPVPLRADQADALVRRDQPVEVFEQEFVAEAFAGAGKLDHAAFIVSGGKAGEWARPVVAQLGS